MENIRFGKPDATEDEVITACNLAQTDEFIKQTPQGYNTVVSESGESFSGGQKQRINIARAIVRNTHIVILDESAAALDAETEARVGEAVRELTAGKTTFMIAHKLSTVLHADKILLLDKGKLIASGTHDELLHKSAEYKKLCDLQFVLPQEHAGRQSKEAQPAEADHD